MRVSSADVRKRFAGLIDAANRGEVIIVERHGQDIAALVSIAELEQWKLEDISDELKALEVKYGVSGPDLFRRLVLDKSYSKGDGSSKDEKLDSIKSDTVKIPDVSHKLDMLFDLVTGDLSRFQTIEAARAAGCDDVEEFDEEGYQK